MEKHGMIAEITGLVEAITLLLAILALFLSE